MTEMLKIMGQHYFLDLNEIDNFIQIKDDELSLSGNPAENHISIVKYETIKLMLEVIMDEHEEIDETLGSKAASSLSIPFRLAFNTLLSKKMLKSY
jgi:hypothetical protein